VIVWVVIGQHPHVPGVRISVHATESGADTAAARLTEQIRMDVNGFYLAPATAENWRTIMAVLEEQYDCHVASVAQEVQP